MCLENLHSSSNKLKERYIQNYQKKVFREDLEVEKNVKKNLKVNTRVVSMCTSAYTAYRLAPFEDYAHMLYINLFGKRAKRKDTFARLV